MGKVNQKRLRDRLRHWMGAAKKAREDLTRAREGKVPVGGKVKKARIGAKKKVLEHKEEQKEDKKEVLGKEADKENKEKKKKKQDKKNKNKKAQKKKKKAHKEKKDAVGSSKGREEDAVSSKGKQTKAVGEEKEAASSSMATERKAVGEEKEVAAGKEKVDAMKAELDRLAAIEVEADEKAKLLEYLQEDHRCPIARKFDAGIDAQPEKSPCQVSDTLD